MAKFDTETLRELREVHDVAGRWYRDLAAGGPATLEFAGRAVGGGGGLRRASRAIARASSDTSSFSEYS